MTFQGCQQLVILDVPEARIMGFGRLTSPPGDVRHQLTQSPLRIALAHLGEQTQHFLANGGHGSLSFTVGYLLTFHFGRWSITSTRTVCPGRNLATRVARVTPLLITSSPSAASVTSRCGMPATAVPNRAMCRASL